jgi:hypothetical protein
VYLLGSPTREIFFKLAEIYGELFTDVAVFDEVLARFASAA